MSANKQLAAELLLYAHTNADEIPLKTLTFLFEKSADYIEPTRLKNRARFDLGFHLYAAGHYSQAADAFGASIHHNPDNIAAHYFTGLCYAKLENHGAALEAFDDALNRIPDAEISVIRTQTLKSKAESLRKIDENERADEVLKQIAKITAHVPEKILRNRMRGLFEEGLHIISQDKNKDYSKALAAFDEYIETFSDNAIAHQYRGICLAGLGRHDEAIEAFEHAEGILPESTLKMHRDQLIGHKTASISALGLS